jgi:hypothetical protein
MAKPRKEEVAEELEKAPEKPTEPQPLFNKRVLITYKCPSCKAEYTQDISQGGCFTPDKICIKDLNRMTYSVHN